MKHLNVGKRHLGFPSSSRPFPTCPGFTMRANDSGRPLHRLPALGSSILLPSPGPLCLPHGAVPPSPAFHPLLCEASQTPLSSGLSCPPVTNMPPAHPLSHTIAAVYRHTHHLPLTKNSTRGPRKRVSILSLFPRTVHGSGRVKSH